MEADERTRDGVEGEPAPTAAERPIAAATVDGDGRVANERCAHHPARSAIARCGACEAPVCLSCAVPVRGRILGPECLAAELGDPRLAAPRDPDGAGRGTWVAVAGAAIAAAGTIAPWTRTGAGDRLFGAWVPNVRWSTVAAIAAVAMLLAALGLLRTGDLRTFVAAALLAPVIVITGALAIAYPPTFQTASWGPWLTAAGGALAAAGLGRDLLTERRSTQGV